MLRNIENLSSDEKIRDALKMHDEKFDLFSFYLENEDYMDIINSGFEIITSSQRFFCYSFGTHERLIENIYGSMYDDFYKIFKCNNYDWRETSINLGNVCLQLSSKYYSTIWMPGKINKYQLARLFEFYDDITRINDYFKSKGKGEIIIMAYVRDAYKVKSFNFIDDFSSILGMVCDTLEVRDEYAIVDRNEEFCKVLSLRQKVSLTRS